MNYSNPLGAVPDVSLKTRLIITENQCVCGHTFARTCTVLDKIMICNLRFVPELGASLFGVRWTCGQYTLEWFDDHVVASHDSSALRGMLISIGALAFFVCTHLFLQNVDGGVGHAARGHRGARRSGSGGPTQRCAVNVVLLLVASIAALFARFRFSG